VPYILKERRTPIEPHLNEASKNVSDVGDLTYSFYVLCVNYVRIHGLRFGTCCGIMGALLCCALEFYRRIVADYEGKKIQENGDVVSTVQVEHS
jgi:hypothetical protein